MDPKGYKIIFEGKVSDGVSINTAKTNLQRLFKTDDATMERVFSGKRVILKKDVPPTTIEKYLKALDNAGVEVRTVPEFKTKSAGIDFVVGDGDMPKPDDAGQSENKEPDSTGGGALSRAALSDQSATVSAEDNTQTDNTDLNNLDLTAFSTTRFQAEAALDDVLADEALSINRDDKKTDANTGNVNTPPEQNTPDGPHVFCRSCGGQIYESDVICPHCGAKQISGKPRNQALVVVLVVAVVIVVIIAILAAISIPAYVEYKNRAEVIQAVTELEPTREAIENFVRQEGYLPGDNEEAGLPKKISTSRIKSVTVAQNGTLQVKLKGERGDALDDQTMLWVPQLDNDSVTWDCSGGTLSKRLRPQNCREGRHSDQQSAASTRWVVADDRSSKMLLPTTWKQIPELTDVATIEFGNTFREQYTIVISEPKADFGNNVDLYAYNDFILDQNFRTVVSDISIKLLGEVEINGMRGVKYEIRGEVDNIKIVYLHTALEGEYHYHQVLFWTLPTKWQGNRKIFENALARFTECPGRC